MNQYDKVKKSIKNKTKNWLITGVAGFIGSNILKTLLACNQKVIGLDNLVTGHLSNLKSVESEVSRDNWKNFEFVKGDILDFELCQRITEKIDFVLHQAALGSVPRSIKDPLTSNNVNVQGFLNVMVASRDSNVKRFVYAASSSTYGDHKDLPKVEENIGNPLSPYGVTKLVNELYADIFHQLYNFNSIGLRYFNVFGPLQDPEGPYAAVIPKWIAAIRNSEEVQINGDGETSRDFCFIDNAVQANILSATAQNKDSLNQVYNVAFGEKTSLNELFRMIKDQFLKLHENFDIKNPKYASFRQGDVRHSLANINKAKTLLGYEPQIQVSEGIEMTIKSYQVSAL